MSYNAELIALQLNSSQRGRNILKVDVNDIKKGLANNSLRASMAMTFPGREVKFIKSQTSCDIITVGPCSFSQGYKIKISREYSLFHGA